MPANVAPTPEELGEYKPAVEEVKPIPPPPNEDKRMEAIRTLGLDSQKYPPDPLLNAMCSTVSKLMDVPMVGVSIVQKDRLYMRASVGLGDDFSCPRNCAFCSWTLLPRTMEVLAIEDATKDPRFSTLPDVAGGAGLRFYAGAPLLTSNGQRLGAVCVLDTQPRVMSAEDYNLLCNFAEITIRRLEERDFKKLKSETRLLRSPSELNEPIVLCDVGSSRWWSLLYCNSTFTTTTGILVDAENAETSFWKLFRPAGQQAKNKVQEEVEEDIRQNRDFKVVVQRRELQNRDVFELTFRPATRANLGNHAVTISVPNIAAAAEIGEAANGYYFATAKKIDTLQDVRMADSQVGVQGYKASRPKQHSFMSALYIKEQPVTSKQPVDMGMRDVTMGVLCSSTSSGMVYRARWRKRSVSVKVIETKESACVRGPEFGRCYVPPEAALSLDLDHPNIISTYKIVVEDSAPTADGSEKMVLGWMVREWCGRGTLLDALHRGWLRVPSGKPNMAAVIAVAQEVAAAVKYLHDQEIIHGDICPESALLTDDKGHTQSKYKDFMCKLSEFGQSIKSTEAVTTNKPGTASHAAPELLSKAEMSFKTDVYAFGMLLWEIYCGQPVWPSLNVSQIQRRVVAAKEKPPLPEDVPLSIKDLIHACLANKAADRPTFDEIVEELRHTAQEAATGDLITALTLEDPPNSPKSRAKFWKHVDKDKGHNAQNSQKRLDKKPSLRKPEVLHEAVGRPSMEGKRNKPSFFKKLIGKV